MRRDVKIENWLSESSRDWKLLSDNEYRQLISDWRNAFSNIIETMKRKPYGNKAQVLFQQKLPLDVYLFSGVRVNAVANMGGRGFPLGYCVTDLKQVDWNLCLPNELIITDIDFCNTMIGSHENGCEAYYKKVYPA